MKNVIELLKKILALVFDIDGSIMPQGGPIDPRVAAIFRELSRLGLPIGPATGKNADYSRGLACGIGTVWDFIIAESGAEFLQTIHKGPPPAYQQRKLAETGDDLSIFARRIELDQLSRRFMLCDRVEHYRPELKSGILTLFPPETAIEVTKPWLDHFQQVIETFRLRLKLQRHSDGCIDVIPNAIAKHLGVLEVARLYQCQPENILTVVDGKNDVELAEGTIPIAVGNADNNIKALARRYDGYVSAYPDGMGFCDGLRHFANQGFFPSEMNQAILAKISELFPEMF